MTGRTTDGEAGRPFLTARWENLALLNFDCPPALLEPLVPAGTELDPWQGEHIVSLVGFHFRGTRLRGIPIPCHSSFEEVNLRFYVRCHGAEGFDQRAVVFVREVVPRRAIAAVARRRYNEPYRAVPMTHRIALDPVQGGELEYSWRHGGGWHRLGATVTGAPRDPESGSEAEYITEHYWGYTRQKDGGTLEYRVEHPRWPVWEARSARYSSPHGSDLYPTAFREILAGEPRTAFVASGSEVAVYPGKRLGTGRVAERKTPHAPRVG